MSFVMLSMMKNSLLNQSLDSKANILNGNNRMMGMLSNPNSQSIDQSANMEKQINFGSIQNQTASKFCDAQIEGLDKQIDKDIKRSMSYFA